jgi:type I restriction enzyme, S subunit
MSDRAVTFSELASENLIEVGAGRPRSVLDQYPSIPILRVADVLDGRIESPSKDQVPCGHRDVTESKVSRAGDVVLTAKGTVGRVALMPSDGRAFAYSPQLCYFRPAADGPLRSRYLYYWFKSAQFWIQADALKGQTDMADYLSLSDVEALTITIPSLGQQDGIIEVLGALDDKIAVNDRIAEKSEELALALALAIASGEQWKRTVPIGEIVSHIRNQVMPDSVAADVVAHYSLPAFDAGRLPEVVSPSTIKSGKFIFEGPAVLLSKLNPATPRVWFVNPDAGLASLASTEFMVLKPIAEVSTAELWAVARQPGFTDELVGMATGTSNSHQRVRPGDLLAAEVVDPRFMSADKRNAIGSLTEGCAQARIESRTLAELRDTLLPKLMSGEIRVRDAEKVVEDVT